MKIFKKLAILAMTAVFAVGMFSFTACGDGKDGNESNNGNGGGSGNNSDKGIEVSDSDWQKYLNFDYETYDSVTIISKNYYSYGKDKAEEYGQWSSETSTLKLDNVNERISITGNFELYQPDAEEDKKFVSQSYRGYTFSYNGAYFDWDDNGGSNSVFKISKANFMQRAESMTTLISLLQVYSSPFMKSMFKFNKANGMYEMNSFGSKIAFQFMDNGDLRLIQELSLMISEITVTNANNTTVTVPQKAYDAVDEYLAKHAD